MGVATIIENAVDLQLATVVTGKSAVMCSFLAPIALTGVTIYIIVMGWAIMRGDAQDSFHTFLWKAFKISVISGIALVGGEYQSIIIDFMNAIPNFIAGVFGNAATIGGMVDNIADPNIALFKMLWNRAMTPTIPDLSLASAAVMVGAAELFMIIVGMGIYILAKVSLALVLAVGPIFILCAMFPATQQKFEGWLGQALNFAFLQGLVGAVIGILFAIILSFSDSLTTAVNASSPDILVDSLTLIAVTVTLCVVLLNLNSISSALTGGSSITGIGSQVGKLAIAYLSGGAAGAAASQLSKNSISNSSSSGGGSTSSSSGGSGSGGGSSAVPLYQRHALENSQRASAQ